MSERDDYEPGVPCWIDTLQPDPDAAMAFYAALFGWEFAGPGEMPGDPPGRYFVARLRGRDVAGIGSQPAGDRRRRRPGTPTSPWPAPTRPRAPPSTRAARSSSSPFDVLPAGRMAVLADPAGAPFCVWQPGERRGAQLVNEPGAWAMSHLTTPGSRARRRVLRRPLRLDDRDVRRGRRRDHHVPPARLRRRRAPAAGLARGGGDDVRRRAATARRAGASTSGTATSTRRRPRRWSSAAAPLAPPFDTPMSRMAVLADPHGATFIDQQRAGVARDARSSRRPCTSTPPSRPTCRIRSSTSCASGRRAGRPRARAVTRTASRSCSRAAACAGSSRPAMAAALERLGLTSSFDLVVGSSAGAINGGALVAGRRARLRGRLLRPVRLALVRQPRARALGAAGDERRLRAGLRRARPRRRAPPAHGGEPDRPALRGRRRGHGRRGRPVRAWAPSRSCGTRSSPRAGCRGRAGPRWRSATGASSTAAWPRRSPSPRRSPPGPRTSSRCRRAPTTCRARATRGWPIASSSATCASSTPRS